LGVRERGVSVAWQTGVTNLYRWGHEGRFDVKVLRAAAADSAGSGVTVQGHSLVIAAQTTAAASLPPVSALVSSSPAVADVGAFTAVLTWTDVLPPAESGGALYEVGLNQSEDGDVTAIGAVTSAIAFLKNLKPETSYYARVRVLGGEWSGPCPFRTQDGACFDEKGSTQGGRVQLANGGKSVTSAGGAAAAVGKAGFTQGSFTVTFLIQREDSSNRSVCYGVATRPISDPSYTSSTSLCVLRASSGTVHKFGVESSEPVTAPFGASGDLINMAVNLDEHTISFTVNDNTFVAVTDLPAGEYFPVITFYNEYEKAVDWVDISVDSPPYVTSAPVASAAPSSSTSSAAAWGFKATVVPSFPPNIHLTAPPAVKAAYDDAIVAITRGWTRTSDESLVSYVNTIAKQRSLDAEHLLNCEWSDIAPPKPTDPNPLSVFLSSNPGFTSVARAVTEESKLAEGDEYDLFMARLGSRWGLIRALNKLLLVALPLIDLTRAATPNTVAYSLSKCRYLVLGVLKDPLWSSGLAKTLSPGDGSFELKLSRTRAQARIEAGDVDVKGRFTVFSQAMRQLGALAPSNLRKLGRVYTAVFIGEFGHDAGGLYRESYSVYCSELMSPALPLLTRCPNFRNSYGQNRETWLPAPNATFPVALDMYKFLGKLMGIAIRNQEYLPLDLPSLVWKQLCGDSVTEDDLAAVDLMLVESMNKLRNVETLGVDADSFNMVFMETFTVTTMDGRTVELIPGGADIDVTFDTRHKFADLVIQYRLHEVDQQCAAIRAGLGQMIPLRPLTLFNWQELQTMVCGSPTVNVDLLKKCTRYEGLSESDEVVNRFWRVLRSMSESEKSLFLKFVWGRSRLPLSESQFTQPFKLTRLSHSRPDVALPVAHTCFFQLDLPNYSSEITMRDKLLYAINNCSAIDGDNTSIAQRAAGMTDVVDDEDA